MAVGSQQISDPYALQFALTSASGSTVPVDVVRGGEQVTVSFAIPDLEAEGDLLAQLGLGLAIKPRFDRVPLGSIIPVGVGQAWEQSGQMLSGIRDLVTGRAPLDQIAGPLGMGQITSEIVSASPLPLWVTLAQLAILLSLNLRSSICCPFRRWMAADSCSSLSKFSAAERSWHRNARESSMWPG